MAGEGYAPKSRLSDKQKQTNHNKSEAVRRAAIREKCVQLAEMMPNWKGKGHQEAKVIEAAVEFLQEQIRRKEELEEQALRSGRMSQGDFEQVYRDEDKKASERHDQQFTTSARRRSSGMGQDESPKEAE